MKFLNSPDVERIAIAALFPFLSTRLFNTFSTLLTDSPLASFCAPAFTFSYLENIELPICYFL
ncbi:MAG TPA: hypothetical protein VIK86_03520 [Candidatus Paceibacterota bacterium]